MNESRRTPDPFQQTYQVALYKSMAYGYTSVSTFYGERDTEHHSDYVRISEPVSVKFVQLANEEAIKNALKTLDAAELQVLAEMNAKIAKIREQKAGLLALTHQPTGGA